MKRGARFLLAMETVVSVPVFIVSWMTSAVIVAARAGWRCASAPQEKKRAALAAIFGKPDE